MTPETLPTEKLDYEILPVLIIVLVIDGTLHHYPVVAIVRGAFWLFTPWSLELCKPPIR